MGRPLKIQKANTTRDIGFNAVASLTAPVTPSGLAQDEFYGVVGGDVVSTNVANAGTAAYPTVKVRVFITGYDEQDGFILRQKGSSTYLVYDAVNGVSGVCTLANQATGALTAGNMTVTVDLADSTDNIRLQRFTNKWGLSFAGVRYFLNFFDVGGETAVKAGAAQNGTVVIAQVEGNT